MRTVDAATVVTILLMALCTYATRIAGLFLGTRRRFTGRSQAAFDAIPPAVLTAVIAPTLLTTGPAETLAGCVTIVAATRLSLLGTVLVGVIAVVLLRAVIGS